MNGCVELISLDDHIESITLCYGESDVEAMDIDYCYYKQIGMTRKMKARKRAFRYLFIPEVSTGMVQLQVFHEFLSLSKQAAFFKRFFFTESDLVSIRRNLQVM